MGQREGSGDTCFIPLACKLLYGSYDVLYIALGSRLEVTVLGFQGSDFMVTSSRKKECVYNCTGMVFTPSSNSFEFGGTSPENFSYSAGHLVC